MDNLEIGLVLLVTGFITVMIVLFLLYLVLEVIGRFFAQKKQSQPAQKENLKPRVQSSPPADAAVLETVQGHAPAVMPEVVAAITAAVASCLDGPPAALHIIPETGTTQGAGTSSWQLTGRKQLMERRQGIALLRRERRK